MRWLGSIVLSGLEPEFLKLIGRGFESLWTHKAMVMVGMVFVDN